MGTHGSGFTKRHSRVLTGRGTHGGANITDVSPSDSWYGTQIDLEQITNQDIAPGAVDGGQIEPGSVPASVFDTTPPSAPTGVALTSAVSVNSDGSSYVILRVSWTDPTDSDLHGVFIEVTDQFSSDGGAPVWTNPSQYFAAKTIQAYDVVGVSGSTTYYVRLRAVDVQGNYSAYTAESSVVTLLDTTPPPVPTNPQAVAGFRGAIFKWDPSSAPDIDSYEIIYAIDDGTGTAPTSAWTTVRARTTTIWISGLNPGTRYWFRVAALDRSKNMSAYTSDSSVAPVTYADPTQVGSADIAANTISSSMISTSGLDANVIKTGLLVLSTNLANYADGIQVFDNSATTQDKMVGWWDEGGIRVYSSTDKSDYILITAASIKVVSNGTTTTAITTDGIDASAINLGRLSGGHNLVPNSSFEVGAFSSETSASNSTFTLDDQSRTSKAGAVVSIDGATW